MTALVNTQDKRGKERWDTSQVLWRPGPGRVTHTDAWEGRQSGDCARLAPLLGIQENRCLEQTTSRHGQRDHVSHDIRICLCPHLTRSEAGPSDLGAWDTVVQKKDQRCQLIPSKPSFLLLLIPQIRFGFIFKWKLDLHQP